jgi:hypothetical protein
MTSPKLPNEAQDLYSEERLEASLRAARLSPRSLVASVTEEPRKFVGATTTHDHDCSLPRMNVVVANDISEVERLYRCVSQFCQEHGLSSEIEGDLNLALEEIVVNVIRYGHRKAESMRSRFGYRWNKTASSPQWRMMEFLLTRWKRPSRTSIARSKRVRSEVWGFIWSETSQMV